MSATLLIDWDSPHPPDCPEFDYEHHQNWQTVLPRRASDTLIDLAGGNVDTREAALDTRPIHHRLFAGLTPDGHDYFAGHYRGEPFPCLRYYVVGIQNDPRVGVPPESVAFWISELRTTIRSAVDALDVDAGLSRRDRLRYLIVFSCRAFELFLRIHPYANGNGHAARFLVWCVLGRYGHWPHRWTVEPRPPDPPYTECIRRYRDGDPAPLERFLAAMLVP